MSTKRNCVIRGTQAGFTEVRYVKLSSPAFVTMQEADRWTEKQAQQCIDDFVKCGEWKAGQFRVERVV